MVSHFWLPSLILSHIIFMVYIRRLSFKTGIGPSPLTRLRKSNVFIGREKLYLAKTRIFGDMIAGNYKSGGWR